MLLISFLLRATKQERKLALKIPRYHVCRKPSQYTLQASGNLQQVETFKYLRVVFTIDGRRNKKIDTRIGKTNTVLREFHRFVVIKR